MKPILGIRVPANVTADDISTEDIQTVWNNLQPEVSEEYDTLILWDCSITESNGMSSWICEVHNSQNTSESELQTLREMMVHSIKK